MVQNIASLHWIEYNYGAEHCQLGFSTHFEGYLITSIFKLNLTVTVSGYICIKRTDI